MGVQQALVSLVDSLLSFGIISFQTFFRSFFLFFFSFRFELTILVRNVS